jgi:hypothetical protein
VFEGSLKVVSVNNSALNSTEYYAGEKFVRSAGSSLWMSATKPVWTLEYARSKSNQFLPEVLQKLLFLPGRYQTGDCSAFELAKDTLIAVLSEHLVGCGEPMLERALRNNTAQEDEAAEQDAEDQLSGKKPLDPASVQQRTLQHSLHH